MLAEHWLKIGEIYWYFISISIDKALFICEKQK